MPYSDQASVARSGSLRSQSDDEFFDATEWLSGYGSDDENEPFNTLDLKTVYEKVDTLLQSTAEADRRAAYDIMSQIAHKHSDNVEFLWRFARTCHLYATCFAKVDEEKRKKFVFEGRDNAFKALKINDHNADVYKWCAATSGVSTDFLLLKEKIEQGYAFK
uniref:Uncharacterized protein n=1 Tax=Plectus sambesii TaxID=2011161 RepID=A0A914UVS9_9BILA